MAKCALSGLLGEITLAHPIDLNFRAPGVEAKTLGRSHTDCYTYQDREHRQNYNGLLLFVL